ncbi:MAG TPA: hypothetical protein VJG30_03795 [Candidatus Nanoarchaeia archaeon]|nr:hypothetical protein [Candidatus Nanoarchaeia archaeon]
MKQKTLLIVILAVILILLFSGSLLMTFRSFFHNFVKDATKESIEFLKECNSIMYENKNVTVIDYKNSSNGVPIVVSSNMPVRYTKQIDKEDLKEILDWCCKNYDPFNIVCRLNLKEFIR